MGMRIRHAVTPYGSASSECTLVDTVKNIGRGRTTDLEIDHVGAARRVEDRREVLVDLLRLQ